MQTKSSETIDQNAKNFLTENEMKKFLAAARKSRHGVRNFCLMLMAYRHGLRVSELVDIRPSKIWIWKRQNVCPPAQRKSLDASAD